ncbi:MAG: hypothetical protein GY812_09220 [Actinomycetia bacterium]|nr:hypothetical protein [Actinomycetes bacterium]
MARIDVIGLGPAGADLLTSNARALWAEADQRFLRTARHPAVHDIEPAASFDHHYEQADTFTQVYSGIVQDLLAAAALHGRVTYAVPGSPVVAESTVEQLLAAAGDELEVVVHPAMSFLDLAWARLGVDPVAASVAIVDGHRFDATRPSGGGAALVAQCESRRTLSDIKLALAEPPVGTVTLLQGLGLPDERIERVDWAEIDRTLEPDHLTSLWIPDLPPTAGGRLDRFAALVQQLRRDDPWKARQDHESLRPYLLEEAHEVLEAIGAYDTETGEGADELASELGDLLYQPVFHAAIASETGWFDLADVVSSIHDKLVARSSYPDWETAKAAERNAEQ